MSDGTALGDWYASKRENFCDLSAAKFLLYLKYTEKSKLVELRLQL